MKRRQKTTPTEEESASDLRVAHRGSPRFFTLLILLVLLVIPLSACTLSPSNGTTSPSSTAQPTAPVTSTSAPSSGSAVTSSLATTPSAVSSLETSTATAQSSTPTPSSTAPPATTSATPSAATPSADVIAAIKQVIQKANQEEEQALASNDPTAMHDTATADYYNQLIQDVQSLSSNGISAIHLSKVDWGPITLQDSSTVIATTSETWDTTLGGQGTLQQTDTNVYTLVLQNGTWKIQSDQHPDSNPPQSATGSKSISTARS